MNFIEDDEATLDVRKLVMSEEYEAEEELEAQMDLLKSNWFCFDLDGSGTAKVVDPVRLVQCM